MRQSFRLITYKLFIVSLKSLKRNYISISLRMGKMKKTKFKFKIQKSQMLKSV